jgi:hypothetical protein
MHELLPGTDVEARGLRWEVMFAERLGSQTLYRLHGLEGVVQGQELDLLHPFEPLHRLVHDFQPEKAAPLRNWLVYHQAFLLEQALGTDALLAAQPNRLRLEPYQLVPVLCAIRISRPRLLSTLQNTPKTPEIYLEKSAPCQVSWPIVGVYSAMTIQIAYGTHGVSRLPHAHHPLCSEGAIL